MERHEEDRVVVPEDLLGPVPVVDVPVDDRHAPGAELRLREPCRDRHVVEEAEAHGVARPRVVARRADEREALAANRLDRCSRREQRRLVARLGGDGVGVEPDRAVERADQLDIGRRVAALEVGRGGRRGLDDLEGVQERGEPLRRLGVAERGVQARERRVAYAVDRRTASASSPRPASPCARPTR